MIAFKTQMKDDLMQYELLYYWVASMLRHPIFKVQKTMLNIPAMVINKVDELE